MAINSQPRIMLSLEGFSVVCRHSCTYNSSRRLERQILNINTRNPSPPTLNLRWLHHPQSDHVNGHRIQTHSLSRLPVAHVNLYQLEQLNGHLLARLVPCQCQHRSTDRISSPAQHVPHRGLLPEDPLGVQIQVVLREL